MFAIVGRLGHPERAFRSDPHRRHERQGLGHGDDRRRASRGRSPVGPLHVTSSGRSRRTIRDRRRSRSTDEQLIAAVADVRTAVEELLAEGVLQAHPTFLRGDDRRRVRAVPTRRRRHGGAGGRPRRPTRCDECRHTRWRRPSPRSRSITSSTSGRRSAEIAPRRPASSSRASRWSSASSNRKRSPRSRTSAGDRGAPLIRAAEGVTVAREVLNPASYRAPHARARLRGGHESACAARIRSATRSSPSGFSSCSTRRGSACRADAIASALAEPSWPGRLDLRRFADGREDAVRRGPQSGRRRRLASYLRRSRRRTLPLVFAGMRDKDVEGMLRALLPVVGPLVVTRASNRRSADPERSRRSRAASRRTPP